ncbi:DNA-binding anti-repressor SinI [Bacillus sp. 1P06AnD]
MENEAKNEHYDHEWMDLMKEAKQSGISKSEALAFIQSWSYLISEQA